MGINRSKAISIYQTEAKRFTEEHEENTPQIIQEQQTTPKEETPPPDKNKTCPHTESVYTSTMLFQLRRMIRLNTKAFAVILKILIQGDPKRKT